MVTRSYSELSLLPTFQERFEYLALKGFVGRETFGYERPLNQRFYASAEWRLVRPHVIARDLGCDLGVEGYEIHDRVYIHHMNPITPDQIRHGDRNIFDPEFLICVTHTTHNAIHYGDEGQLPRQFVTRRPGDTQLWDPIRR